MKRVFFVAMLSLITLFGISATVANFGTTTSDNHPSSVTAYVAGLDKEFEFDTETLVAIYNLMPRDVQSLCRDSYTAISSRLERSSKAFTYAGVKITPISQDESTDLKFCYGRHSVVVNNYTKDEFDTIFGL